MATAIQRRRGTTTQHGSFTGLAGEITIDTTKNTVVVHDGSTAGGIPLAKSSEVTALGGADITAVVAGNGLSGGSTSGDATINLDLNELTAAAVSVANDSIVLIDADDSNGSKKESIADLVSAMAGTNITASSGTLGMADTVIRGKVSVTDAGGDGSLAYNSTSGVITYTGPSASEVRAHISGGTGITVTDGVIATTITQYTEALSRGDISVTDAGGDGSLAYNSTTGVITYTGPSAAEARAHISVTDAGGDGSMAYNSGTGVITYTGPSASEVRAHISGGTGVTVSSGAISIGQAVATSSDVTFADVIVSGNLTVSGTQTSVNTETLTVDDNVIVLNNNESGTPSQDAGIEVERGTSTNVKLQFDEGTDKWQFTNDGSTYNDILTVTQVEALLSVTDAGGDGSLAYNNTTGVFTYTGPSAAEVRAHISGSTGIDVSSGAISIDATVATLTGSQTLTNKTLTSPVINTGVSGSAILDSDTMSGASATTLSSSESIKAYVDAQVATKDALSELSGDTDDVTEGSTNLYFTNARADARIAAADTDSLSEGSSNLYHTTARARAAISVSGDLAYNSGTGVISFTNDAGDIESVVAGAGLTGGGTSGDVTVNAVGGYGITVNANDIEVANADIRGLFSASGDVSYNSSTGVISFTNDAGDIESVTAGNGLSGGGSSGAVTLNLDLNELTAAAVDVTADSFAMIDGGDNSSKKESVADLVTAMAGTNLTASSGTLGIADSIIRGKVSVTDAGGLGSASYNASTGVITYTGPSNGDITGLISVTDAGGDGSLAYSSGEITYTGPSASEVRAHFSAGTGIDISSGVVSTDDSAIDIHSLSGYVANEHINHSSVTITAGAGLTGGGDITTTRTLNVVGGDGITANANDIALDGTVVRTTGTQSIGGARTFSNDVIVSGNLTINGTQTTVSTETLTVEDNIIVLNNGTSGTPSENAGIQVDRGSSDDVFFQFDESNDVWQFTNDGSTYFSVPTTSNIRGAVSVTDAGGDGSLAYNSGTGVITYTGPSASQVRAHFSGGTGVDISSGVITFDGSELSTSTTNADGDHFVVVDDSNASRKLTKGSINISGFNNDSGFTTNVGDITGVTAGTGLSGGGSSGGVTLNVSGLTTTELAAGSLQVASESFSDSDTVLMSAAAINDRIESFGYTTNVGDITGVTAGTGLSGGGSSGGVTLNVSGLTVSELAGGSLQTSGESFSNDDTSLMTSAAIEDKILSYGYTTTTGDITGVVAGTGLTGGATSGSATLNVNTGAVSNGASTIPTGDQVYDFVIAQGYTTNVGDITGVTAGTLLDGGGSSGSVTLNVDLTELPDMTAAVVGSADELVILDDGVQSRKLISEITLSDFNNDSGFTTNVGDITAVTAGSFLTGGGSSGGVTLNVDATSANTASKVVARDGSGNFSAGTITATATQAQYADLAEIYSADEDYEPGTVVVFGGDAEVTACEEDADHKVAGVVSTDPAYLMNSDADGVAIALKGRVPCKVTGHVEKGALIVTSSIKGHGMQANNVEAGRVIGKAIQGKNDHGEGVIEILVV